ncbi:hypothetical protein QYF36_011867 [Acer negundo]|nr:hypothetical protein QYF36_011867 [Acer negundo]
MVVEAFGGTEMSSESGGRKMGGWMAARQASGIGGDTDGGRTAKDGGYEWWHSIDVDDCWGTLVIFETREVILQFRINLRLN